MKLGGEELDENKIKLLNLGPKFVPTENRKRPYMDIIVLFYLFFIFWNINTVLIQRYTISVTWNKTKIILQEARKCGKFEEASMAYHREPQKLSVQTTEVFALDLEREGKFSVAESLWQNISRIITKDLKKKDKSNLSFAERKAVTEMKHDKNISTYPFDKGTGLVVIKKEDAIQRIEEQIRKSKVIDNDPI